MDGLENTGTNKVGTMDKISHYSFGVKPSESASAVPLSLRFTYLLPVVGATIWAPISDISLQVCNFRYIDVESSCSTEASAAAGTIQTRDIQHNMTPVMRLGTAKC
jgi:hypothetical protein